MDRADKIIRGLLFCYVAFYLGKFFLPLPYATEISCCLLFLILFFSLPNIRRFNRNVCLGFFACGLVIFLLTGAPSQKLFFAIQGNGGLVALFSLIPVMSMPFFYEDYREELGNITRRYTSSVLPFLLFILFSAYSLALIVFMGCFVILYHLFVKKAKEYDCTPLFHTALLQGYMAAGFWGPSWPPSSIIPNRLGMNWLEIVPAGAAFSFVMLACTTLCLWWAVKNDPQRHPRFLPDKSVQVDWRRVQALALLAAALVGGLVLVNYATRWSMYIIVPLTAFPFALAAALLQGKMDKFKSGAATYYKERIISSKAECCLFIVAGFLGGAIEYSKVGELAVQLMPETLFDYPALVAFAIVAALIAISFVGVHPVVSVPSVALALSAEHIGVNQLSFALMLLSGWVLGLTVSPFSGGVMLLAGFSGKSSWAIGPFANWKFAVGMAVIFSLMVSLLYGLTK